jgi:hypothetical protein
LWGWWAGRALKCPWDVPIIIAECGIDMYVKDGSVQHQARGWRGRKTPQQYASELADYVGRMSADPRFVGCCPFTSDYANGEWASFDVEPAYQAILSTPIPTPTQPVTTHLPILGTGPEPVTVDPAPQPSDTWARSIAFVKRWEGGFVDHPSDPGGATNKGITIGTFIRWRIERGLPTPTVDDLRAITDAEANEIYYQWYWLASGSDKLPWPLCLAHFDTAVNAGVGRANEMMQASKGDFLAYMGHLISWYTRIPNFEVFGRAWIRRRAELLLEAAQ